MFSPVSVMQKDTKNPEYNRKDMQVKGQSEMFLTSAHDMDYCFLCYCFFVSVIV